MSFGEMHAALLAGPLAEDITLAGQPARALVDHNFKIYGEYGAIIARVTAIDIAVGHQASKGTAVIIGGKPGTLDECTEDDGQIARWIVKQ